MRAIGDLCLSARCLGDLVTDISIRDDKSSNGCVPLDVGAIRIASMIASTLSCGTALDGSIFLVA